MSSVFVNLVKWFVDISKEKCLAGGTERNQFLDINHFAVLPKFEIWGQYFTITIVTVCEKMFRFIHIHIFQDLFGPDITETIHNIPPNVLESTFSSRCILFFLPPLDLILRCLRSLVRVSSWSDFTSDTKDRNFSNCDFVLFSFFATLSAATPQSTMRSWTVWATPKKTIFIPFF